MSANTTALTYAISNSVGRKSKGAINEPADVETIQNMLRLASMIESDQHLDPGAIDGTIDDNEAQDDTIRAIEVFQSRFVSHPDGLLEVGKRTWKELMTVLDGDHDDAETDAQFFFPFKVIPAQNWTEGMRKFGANRNSGNRAHAGCDLYHDVGTTIYAIASGTVVRGPYYFYQNTYALEIDHGSFLARYGEIQSNSMVREGDHVSAGQAIARVGDLSDINVSMLHFELYDKSAHGPLNVDKANSKKRADGVPFMRRRDLIDPTAKLNQWKNNLP